MSTENPWTTLSSEVVYKNNWIVVREDQVIRPDGKPGIYGVIETRIATGILALTDDLRVYLVGQYRYPMEEYSWEIIEGGGEDGEEAIAAATRELREEAGLEAEHWEPLGGEIHLSNCFTSERAYLFLATGLKEVEASPEGTEQLEIKVVPVQEALRMVRDGEMKDAMSIMGLYRLEQHLRATGRL